MRLMKVIVVLGASCLMSCPGGSALAECASDRNPGRSSSLCGPLDVVIVPVYIQYTATEGHLLILFYLKHGEFQLKVGFLGVQEQINSLHYFLLGK